jgi:hypothetical protein
MSGRRNEISRTLSKHLKRKERKKFKVKTLERNFMFKKKRDCDFGDSQQNLLPQFIFAFVN